jgi:hypothetical protein
MGLSTPEIRKSSTPGDQVSDQFNESRSSQLPKSHLDIATLSTTTAAATIKNLLEDWASQFYVCFVDHRCRLGDLKYQGYIDSQIHAFDLLSLSYNFGQEILAVRN